MLQDNFLNVTKVMSTERWWTTLNDKRSPGTFVFGTSRPDNGIVYVFYMLTY